jgi:hypothetical protein
VVSDPDGWAAPLPGERSDRLRAVLPLVVLFVVAALGFRNHIVRDQSSWQGASFGMFATYENDISRTVIVTVDRGDGPERVALPSELDDDVRRLAVVPTKGAARDLARAVLDLVDGADVTVTVEVRRVALEDDEDLRLHLETLVQASERR